MPISFTPVTLASSVEDQIALINNSLNSEYENPPAKVIYLTGSAEAAVGTATTLGSSVNPSTFGQLVTFTATVSPTSGTTVPTGTVQFSEDGSAAGSPVTLSGGQATYATSVLSAGTHSISAVYTPASGTAFTTSSATALSISSVTLSTDIRGSCTSCAMNRVCAPSVPTTMLCFGSVLRPRMKTTGGRSDDAAIRGRKFPCFVM